MSIPTLTGLSASSNSASNYVDAPVALLTVGRTTVANTLQLLRISPNGITFTNGTNVVAIPIQDAWNLAVNSGDIGLSYPPVITVDPSDASVAAPAATSFSITAVSEELALTYQWQHSTDNGSSWSNLSDAGVYSNTTNAGMNISNSTGLNGNWFRCTAYNALGNSSSNAGILTVT